MGVIPNILQLVCILTVLNFAQTLWTKKQYEVSVEQNMDNCINKGFCDNFDFTLVPDNVNNSTQQFRLARNRIIRIEKTSFQGYKELVDIDLAANFIEFIEDGSFEYLSNLQRLYLSDNKLRKFNQRLPSLKNLDLGQNPLEEFYAGENTIQYLRLDSTLVSKIPSPSNNVTFLHMRNTSVSKYSLEDIIPFCKLQIFNISNKERKLVFADECSCVRFENWKKTEKDAQLQAQIKKYKTLYSFKCPGKLTCEDDQPIDKNTIDLLKKCIEKSK